MRKEISAPTPVEAPPLERLKYSLLNLPDRTVVGKKNVLEQIKIKKDVVVPKEAYDLFEDEPVKKTKKLTSNRKKYILLGVEALAGGFLIAFGVINAGSYYEEASRMGGTLANIFYTYQLGTLFMILGAFIGYDAVRRVRE